MLPLGFVLNFVIREGQAYVAMGIAPYPHDLEKSAMMIANLILICFWDRNNRKVISAFLTCASLGIQEYTHQIHYGSASCSHLYSSSLWGM